MQYNNNNNNNNNNNSNNNNNNNNNNYYNNNTIIQYNNNNINNNNVEQCFSCSKNNIFLTFILTSFNFMTIMHSLLKLWNLVFSARVFYNR